MTTEPTEFLVLADQAGNHYLLSRRTPEQARLPEARKAEIERHLAREEVAGFGSTIEERPSPFQLTLLGPLSARRITLQRQGTSLF